MDTSDGAAAAAAGLDEADAAFFSRSRHRCCCFSAPWQSSSTSSYARRAAGGGAGTDGEWWHQVGDGGARAGRRRWWRRGVDALMKVREWSELVAGPRWKTFIRSFRRGHHRHAGAGGGRKLNYDALNYALNFDEGACSPEDGGAEYPDFSARFAAPPGSVRTSMDLGARDAPSLFHHQPPPHAPPAAIAAAKG
ncbi:uncharacterized protein [Lolium perenne]|uniref:uncharacterized protein n=1 Tax=Lolium perenne TaxID=4522 RepID=UPI0021EA4602|nr:uncharacterized protein LOC127317534 [Lolium perenne]